MRQMQSSNWIEGRGREKCRVSRLENAVSRAGMEAIAEAGCVHGANLRSECELVAPELGVCGVGASFTQQRHVRGSSVLREQQHPVGEQEVETAALVASAQRLDGVRSPNPLAAIDIASTSGRAAFCLPSSARMRNP
jgi:hypothetical protein